MFSDQPGDIIFGEIIILTLALTNNAANFFLYVMTSQKFRIELLKMLGCRRFLPNRGESSAYRSGGTGSTAAGSKISVSSVSTVSTKAEPKV